MNIAIDVHAHLLPIEADRLASIDGVSWEAGENDLLIDGHRLGIRALFEPESLLAWMDSNHIQRALVSVPPPAYREHLGDAQTELWCRYLNDVLRRVSERFSDRLSPLAHLPIHAPAVATRIVQEEVAAGRNLFSAPAGAPNVEIASAAFDPLWQLLSKSHAFLLLHPGSCADGRLSSFYMSNLVGNPHETGLAVASLVLGGVVTRHPGITFCLAHGGGSAPMMAGRLQRGQDTARPGVDANAPNVSDALAHFIVDCITHDEAALSLAEHTFGKDNIVFGSDWPFPMGLPEPARQLAGWEPERRKRICSCGAVHSRLRNIANKSNLGKR